MSDAMDKIRKLLALASNNPNSEEATQAALKAQRLMYEHGIEELSTEASEKVVRKDVEQRAPRTWRRHLAHAIAPAFRCEWASSYDGIVFYGYPKDVEAATAVFETLYEIGDRLGNRAVRTYKKQYPRRRTNGIYPLFVQGFAQGVADQLRIQSKALAVIVPEEVQMFIQGKVVTTKTKLRAPKMTAIARSEGWENTAYSLGYNEGKKAVSTPVEDSNVR